MDRSKWVLDSVRDWAAGLVTNWNRFWFEPRLPHTLALIRIATGSMLLYIHVVLAGDLLSFLGPDAWIDNATIRDLHQGAIVPENGDWGRSYLWWIDHAALLWGHHLLMLLVAAALMLGLGTRVVAPLAWGMQLMYVHRLTGSLFGLDQIVTMLLMYLMLAPCGAVYSLDAKLRGRFLHLVEGKWRGTWKAWMFPSAEASPAVTIATRLGQLHLCVIYLFGGLWKARGETWWDGSALWFSVANYEYQSLDVTWLVARYPLLCSAAAHATIFWETFYCALVWPKLTRPFVLMMAVMVHGGIAICLGMVTFGWIMIVANCLFVSPTFVRGLLSGSGGNKPH
ncbi:hypothetical protein FF011L_50480 [Roseimaritima multifibrata]|uniref:HTTM-like domain-containing protein n=1 Tax=Roseimaritima multifibrata TaxID=1930274 RepID=A0A517MMY5_9BACT|nr:hypothetical protein [Roseimaritima multifibrata]QDS96240.1 hypothetical protein FF011L_50480 [Roseimaritima multifibrata]